MAITAAQVKELRDKTGAGMMDAKKALSENDGDMDAAVDWLRTKGLAKAAKKSGRTAAEGLVAVKVEAGKGVAVEVNAETDFVAKNADFQEMVGKIAEAALGAGDIEALKSADLDGKSVEDTITDKIATIGENMSVRRMAKVSGGTVVSYVHNAATAGMGKIGVLVAMEGGDDAFGKQVDAPVGGLEIDRYLWIAGHERRDHFPGMKVQQAYRAGHANAAAGFGVDAVDRLLGRFRLDEHGVAVLDIAHAGVGGLEVPRRAVDQAYAESFLQERNASTECRLRDTQGAAGRGKTAMLDRFREVVEIVQVLHSPSPVFHLWNTASRLRRLPPSAPAG